MTNLTRLGAKELSSLIASGKVSALDAVEQHIARIEKVNPLLNAVVVKRYDQAREEARALDEKRARGERLGPLHGVPITIKECLDFGGLPSTFGVTAHRHDFPGADVVYVDRLRRAGAVVVGKTNVAQLLLFMETDNPLYGRTQNPWDLARSPGGSSGGEAAIIAALGSPLGLGTDIGGSCRNPAAVCGIVGFKPTEGRLPDQGLGSISIGELAIQSQVGMLARRVEDIALGLEIANGGRFPASEEWRPLGDTASVDLSKLVVGYFVDDGVFRPCAAAERAVHEARDALSAAGAKVVPFTPPDMTEAMLLFFRILTGDGGRTLARFLDGSSTDYRIRQIMMAIATPRAALPLLRTLLRLTGRKKLSDILDAYGWKDTASHWDAVRAMKAYRARFAGALDRASPGPIDVLLSPSSPLPAIRHGATAELLTMGTYTSLYNVLGYPAGVVPVTRVRAGEETTTPRSRDVMDRTALATERDSAGLPITVQIAARPFREHVALAVMKAVEDAARAGAEWPGPDALPAAMR